MIFVGATYYLQWLDVLGAVDIDVKGNGDRRPSANVAAAVRVQSHDGTDERDERTVARLLVWNKLLVRAEKGVRCLGGRCNRAQRLQ